MSDTEVQGRIERVHEGLVQGWAWRPAQPDERVTVRVLIDGEEVGHTTADLPRPSLAAAGVGDGAHAFRFRLPELSGAHVLGVFGGAERLLPARGFAVHGLDAKLEIETAVTAASLVEGRLDRVLDGVVEGWAWRPKAPQQRVTVHVLLDGESAGEVLAELPRPSLAAAGIGDGSYAFRCELPAEMAHPGSRFLTAEVAGVQLTPSTGFRVETTRSDNPWYGARFLLESPEPELAYPSANGSAAPAPPRPPAVAGHDGWLFDGGLLGVALADELTARAERGVAAMLDTLDQLGERVAQMEVKLLPLLCPMKEHVYWDLLPALGQERLRVRPGDLLLRGLLAHPTLEALDLMPALLAGAEELPVFVPGWSRLSEWGTYCAYRAVIKRLAVILPSVAPPVELDASNLLQAPGRHVKRATAILTETGLVPCSPEDLPVPAGEPVVIPPDGGATLTPREHLDRLAAELAVGWEQADRRALGRCLLVGGAVHEPLAEWCARHFRYTVLIDASAPVVDIAMLERPDVIVYAIDERALIV